MSYLKVLTNLYRTRDVQLILFQQFVLHAFGTQTVDFATLCINSTHPPELPFYLAVVIADAQEVFQPDFYVFSDTHFFFFLIFRFNFSVKGLAVMENSR